jgi:RNA polymerase sigma factor (sigma-70 family)
MARQALSLVVEQVRVEASRTVPDAELLEQFLQTRDETAFAALVRRHRATVLAACRQVLLDDADVEDSAQQTFLALWRNARSIRNRQSVGGWLFGVAHRLAVKELILTLRRREVEGRAGQSRTEAADATDISWREACVILHEELDRLADKHRLPLLLCYLDGKSRDEAAKQLGRSVHSLRGHLERGRLRLRARLARRGVTLSAGLLAAVAGTQATAGPVLSSAAILKVVMEQAPRASAVWSVRRLVLLAAFAVGVAGGGVRLSTLTPEEPPAPPPNQAIAEQPATAAGHVTVSGRVLDPDGKPLAGARIYSLSMRTGKSPFLAEDNLEAVARGTTGADGRFRFDAPMDQLGKGPGGDSWPIMASAESFGLGWTPSPEAAEEVTIRLVKDQPISGRVVDSEGRPVPNATIRISTLMTGADDRLDAFLTGWKAQWNDAWSHVPKRTLPPSDAVKVTRTDRDGRFRITGVGAERLIELEVKAPTVAQAKLFVVSRGGFDGKLHNQAAENLRPSAMRHPGDTPQLYPPTFNFVAAPAKTISGVVRTADGQPVEGALVGASTLVWGSGSVTATTAADGFFTLTGLPKQPTYLVGVTPEKSSPLLGRTLNVPDTEGLQPVSVDIALLARGVVVTGRVIDKSTGKGVLSSVRFAPLPENTIINKPGYDSYKHNRAGTATNKDGKFNLKIIPGPGVLIVQANSGESLNGQYLNPYMLATFDVEDRKHVKVVEDGRNGYFAGAGNSYESLGAEHAVKYLDLAEDAGPLTMDLYLHRAKTAKLAIRDVQGQPLSGAIVGGVTAAWPITFAVKSSECPVYALDPAKPRTLAIYHPGRNLGAAVVVRGDEVGPVIANLQPAGTVTGRALDADGQPICGGDVIVSFPSPAGSELDRYRQQQRPPICTDKDGRFKLDGVVPGLKFGLNNVRKGNTIYLPNPFPKPRELAAGESLDLGDIRMVSRPQ